MAFKASMPPFSWLGTLMVFSNPRKFLLWTNFMLGVCFMFMVYVHAILYINFKQCSLAGFLEINLTSKKLFFFFFFWVTEKLSEKALIKFIGSGIRNLDKQLNFTSPGRGGFNCSMALKWHSCKFLPWVEVLYSSCCSTQRARISQQKYEKCPKVLSGHRS